MPSPVSIILKSADLGATIDWYQLLGFTLLGVYPEAGAPTWCEVSRDGVTIQFLAGDTPWPEPPTMTGTVYFYPESIEAFVEEIREHVRPEWGPEVREWGMREVGIRDPNGYYLTFTEPA